MSEQDWEEITTRINKEENIFEARCVWVEIMKAVVVGELAAQTPEYGFGDTPDHLKDFGDRVERLTEVVFERYKKRFEGE